MTRSARPHGLSGGIVEGGDITIRYTSEYVVDGPYRPKLLVKMILLPSQLDDTRGV